MANLNRQIIEIECITVSCCITDYFGICIGGSHNSDARTSDSTVFVAKAGNLWSELWPGRPLVPPVRNTNMMANYTIIMTI